MKSGAETLINVVISLKMDSTTLELEATWKPTKINETSREHAEHGKIMSRDLHYNKMSM